MSAVASQITGNSKVYLFVQSNIKEKIKDRVTGPLWGEYTGDRWFPLTKGK